jgi:dihydroneopterin aldolase
VFTWKLNLLRSFVIDKLTNYEEVYETVCPKITQIATKLFEEIVEEIFTVISKPKKVEVDLTKFSKVDDMTRYLLETYLNYGHISEKFSKGVSELESKLTEARKQLFLRISP